MKTKMIAFLMVLLLIVLAGCNNTPSNEDKPQPFSSSESSQSSTESETPVGNEKKEVETTPVAVQESEPEKQEETTEKKTVNSEQPQTVSETEQAVQSVTQLNEADKTENSVSKPQPDIPEESEAPMPTETEETTSKAEIDFDIDYWISFAKDYAQSVGLQLDSEAVYCCRIYGRKGSGGYGIYVFSHRQNRRRSLSGIKGSHLLKPGVRLRRQ